MDISNSLKVKDTVTDLAKEDVEFQFYPVALANHLKLDSQEVFGHLLRMVELKYLQINYMVRCDQCDFLVLYDQIDITGDKDKRVYTCPHCKNESKATLEQVIPRFAFTDEYKKHVKKQKNKRGNLRSLRFNQ